MFYSSQKAALGATEPQRKDGEQDYIATKANLHRETVSASEMLDLGPNSTFQLLSLTACEPATSGLLVILRFRCIPVSQGKGTPGNVRLLNSAY